MVRIQKSGTVHGTPLAAGLQESEAFPEPIYTPSTKAEQGEHDENINKEKAVEILGGDRELASAIEELAIKLYKTARDYAKTKGIIIADTKFEFGYIEDAAGKKTLVLVDEVLTPDSSRFGEPTHIKSVRDRTHMTSSSSEIGLLPTTSREKTVSLFPKILSSRPKPSTLRLMKLLLAPSTRFK